jgi:hydroxymethylglutaryl-CoA lyase
MSSFGEDQPDSTSITESRGYTTDGDEHKRDVVVVEVGPRDGLQNESALIPTDTKIAFVDALSAAGLPLIETTSFVSARAVPQLADAAEVMTGIRRFPGVRYPVLVPNLKGLERALVAGVDAIALFTSATDVFAEANVGTTISGTFDRFAEVAACARQRSLWMRGYVSVAFGCPFSGLVPPAEVVPVVTRLLALGCDEICLADTIGVATPQIVDATLEAVLSSVPAARLALHFHDTSGQALKNVDIALRRGIHIFDSAAGGLGGCPFAPGAPGNLATELLVDHLRLAGLNTGVNLDAVAAASAMIAPHLSRELATLA